MSPNKKTTRQTLTPKAKADAQARTARAAQALRDNLKKRKAQQQKRSKGESNEAS